MKKLFLFILSIFLSFSLFAFDWPIENAEENQPASYFGQNKGGILSTSLIFSNPSEVHSTEKGKVLILLTEESDDNDFFPSTLGTSYIIQHDDNLISVYGNLDTENVLTNEKSHKTDQVEAGDILGLTGNSGCQDKKSSLEFQILDTLSKSAINPQILLSKNTNSQKLTIQNIYLENKSGEIFDIKNSKTFASGVYRFYELRNEVSVPYKSSILINGALSDQISYDTIIQENGKNCVIGKKKYSSSDIYPNSNLILLGEAMLTSGRSALTLIVQDIFEETKQSVYTISVY